MGYCSDIWIFNSWYIYIVCDNCKNWYNVIGSMVIVVYEGKVL